MGNASSSRVGNISLAVDPPCDPLHPGYYVAGGKIRGVVYAQSLQENLPPDSAMDVYLTGKEHVKVRYTVQVPYRVDGETRYRTETRYAFASRDIVRINVPIVSDITNGYNVGRYEYPFEIDLPYHLPTTMHHGGYGEYCRIVYKLKVQLRGSWFNNNKQEYEIPMMMAPMPINPVAYNIQPFSEKVKFCCCFDRGSIMFGASVDDTRVARGEQVNISFACLNESTAEIEYVSARISEKIWWSAHGHSSRSTNILVSRTFQRTERMDKLSKSELKRSRDSDSSNESQQRALTHNNLKKVFDAITNSENMVSLFIPHTANHTYRGQCCGVEHILTIEIKTSFGVSNPKVRIPLQIGAASEKSHQDVPTPTAPPSHWNIAPPEPEIEVPVPSLPVPSAPPPNWEADVVVSPIVAPSSNQVYVGAVVESEQEEDDMQPTVPVVPVPVIVPTNGPSIQGLIDELNVSVSASSVVKQRVEDEVWKNQVFATLTPQQFVKIVCSISIEFDQAEVAATIAPVVNQFTCQYVIATIRRVSEWLRITMIRRLLPHTVDLAQNSGSILSELSDWEKMSTEKDFEMNLTQG